MRDVRLPLLILTLLVATGLPSCSPARPATDTPLRVLFLGDSLTSGFGLASRELAFPALLARALADGGPPLDTVNAGVPGDTTADALRRLPALLQPPPDVVVVALGGNDALHDRPVRAARRDLEDIVRRCRTAGAAVLLVGLELPPVIRRETARDYAELWAGLSGDLDLPLVPSLLDGALGVPGMMQDDGLHPTAAGQVRLAHNVEPALRALVRDRGR